MKPLFALILLSLFTFAAYAWWNDSAAFEGKVTRIHWIYRQDIEVWRAVNGECSYWGCYPEHSYKRSEDIDCSSSMIGDAMITTCDTDYFYTLNQWVKISTQSAANDRTLPEDRPYYPTLSLSRAYGGEDCAVDLEAHGENAPLLGCQRAGRQYVAHYVVIETESLVENFQGRCEIEYSTWIELRFEDRVTGRYYSNRNTIDCDSIEF